MRYGWFLLGVIVGCLLMAGVLFFDPFSSERPQPTVPSDAAPSDTTQLAVGIVREWLAGRPQLTKDSSWDCLSVHEQNNKGPFSPRVVSPGVVEVHHDTVAGLYVWTVYMDAQVVDPSQRPEKAGIC